MLNRTLTKVFGSKHERDIKRMQPLVAAINDLEPEIQALSDEQLRAKTAEFRQQLDQGASLDDLLVPAFAVVREAAIRSVEMRPFDVQLIGGVVLHQGMIAEMKTGEGKTLVATMPVYLNALTGKGVHVVTVNDYLASRDSEWMGAVYRFLGLSVGVIQSDIPDADRKQAYAADVTYGTNNEFGFDYLRDNMKFDLESMVQRGHYFAIVDEVDSILVDEARTPLIISGPSEESVGKYDRINRIIPRLKRGEEIEDPDGTKRTTGDFLVDEKAHNITLTEEGGARCEQLLGIGNLYDLENVELLHGVNQGLRAHHLFKRDVEYLIKEGQVVIVDEFTGRMMPGRRWSDGLHQAVEAKEGVTIERENQTLATITFQNYFRMYDKLGGMTGTAETEATEFGEIYDLDVVVIPTNQPMVRDDRADVVFRTGNEKWDSVAEEIADCQERGQPVLVGTVSIENSEMLSKKLKRKGIRHVVLNAKFHGKEAGIVAQAASKGSVTIATNMAGRGTDIVLGGNAVALARGEIDPAEDQEAYDEALERHEKICRAEREEVLAAGGLHILGTERHESRRIDNQLRGRSGRQGDAGSSRFFLSLEDDLMRIFGSERMRGFIGRGMVDGEPIEHKMVSRAIEKAQSQVEGRNFEVRKHLLEYDDVMNKQREAIYELRKDILSGKEGRDYVLGIAEDIIGYFVDIHCPAKADPRDWNLTAIHTDALAYFQINLNELAWKLEEMGPEEIEQGLLDAVKAKYDERLAKFGEDVMRSFERFVLLREVDLSWKDHLLALDHLKEGIGLRGYGQKDPKQEYKRESFELFQAMKERIEDSIVKKIFSLEPVHVDDVAARRRAPRATPQSTRFSAPFKSAQPQRQRTVTRQGEKVGRNDACPCGSGKKYKKCCLAKDRATG
jgi:preprotein translocase subunit SecA